jgi:hypothetical protein
MQGQAWEKLIWLTIVSLCISIAVPFFVHNSPIQAYQPNYWQPVSRVNPGGPVNVMLVNQTKSPLKYNFLDDRGEKDLPVGGNAKEKISFLPIDIAIYDPAPQTPASKIGGLKYQTTVDKQNNDVTVRVLSREDSRMNVVKIAKTGAIYVY